MRAEPLMVLVLLSLATCAIADEDDLELLMSAPAGPYRGSVVDAVSKRPLANAAVVLIWQGPDDRFPQSRRTVAVSEALTDGTGQFVFDVASIEQRLATKSFPPRIMIFKPGYAYSPQPTMRHPPGALASRFAVPGVEVSLTPVTDYDDHAEAFNQFVSLFSANGVDYFPLMYPTPRSGEEIPQTLQVLREEFQHLLATAPKPPGPGGTR
jgi:hypothetical protein